MTGDEFRARRMELGLYQGNLAQQLQALGLELPGGQKIDQPSISQMERGRLPIPAEVAAALATSVQPGTDSPPPVGGHGRASGGDGDQQPRKPRSRVRKKEPAAPAAAPPPAAEGGAEPQTAGGVTPPSPPADAPPEPERERVSDRPPAPPEAVPQPSASSWDATTKSQLESDLRDLFAGQSFLVPMRVALEDGSYEIRQQEAFIPGLAQVVGAVDTYDGQVIELHAASMAHAWAELANENPTVRRFLMGMTYGGAWRGVIAATLPVVLAIAGNHGLGLPGFLTGGNAIVLEP
jgi:hypothetical protein